MQQVKPAANATLGAMLFICAFAVGCLGIAMTVAVSNGRGQLAWVEGVLAAIAVLLTLLCTGTSQALLQLDDVRLELESLQYKNQSLASALEKAKDRALETEVELAELKRKLGE